MHTKLVLLVVGALLLTGLGTLLVSRGASRPGLRAPEPAATPRDELARAPGALDSADPGPASVGRLPAAEPATTDSSAAIAAEFRDADPEALEIYRSDLERRMQRVRDRIGFQRLSQGTCKHVKTQLGAKVDLGAAAKEDVEERFPGRKAYEGAWAVSGSGSVEVVGIAEGENPEYDELIRKRDWVGHQIGILGGTSCEGAKACPVPGLPKSN